MSAPVDEPKTVAQPEVGGTTEPAPAPVLAADNAAAPVIEEPKTEEAPKTETEPAAPAEEAKEEAKEEKVVEPIYSGTLGYKAPGLKNAFRFAKKYFWFGEEPVAADNLAEYLRGEKPEIAHPVVAWSSQTGKGLLFFVKHADKKEHPAGALNLAYATDLAKDGALAFAFKLSGHKHTFEAQSAAERDGWFLAVEKAITEAKASKDTIESSEGYKETKEKIGKPTALAGATPGPKKSMDATPKLAEGETAAAGEPVASAGRAGSSSSSSSDEEKAKKSKSKSRSASRGKRTSLFGGLMGKKDKEHKDENKTVKEEPETKTEEPAATAPHLDEIPTTAPVNASDVVKPAEETTAETTAPAAVVPTEDATKADETATPAVAQEKPKPTKRGSLFGTFVEKLKSPTTEKKEAEAGLAPAPVKEDETVVEPVKPVEETTPVVAPSANEAAAAELNKDETKPVVATSTPSKEKEHFSFGKLFGSKDRAKSPAPQEKLAEPKTDAAPQIADNQAPATTEPVEATPATEAKPETTEEPKQDKRKSFFGNLGRSLSKATGNKDKKEKKETASPAPVTEEEAAPAATPVVPEEKKEETPVAAAGDVPAENISVGDASKSANPTVATTA
ncbi:immunogenic protein [Stemphylium lycopersici]|uniref:Immunogenic protein n=1 Tax=Stemphylium lycopersici TaxID=183478 RepID=A0A364N328_STELY|nr:immunogenic protein [Stemphylium lycopersici]RAR10523.1 immunogenic protein [Stemphylium lycopersici]